MPTKVLQKNQYIAPFLGDRFTFIKGLDPLGLQNSSVRTYSYLMPGLNNLTAKIRYYSFYCWVLDQYAKRVGDTNYKEQQKFMRRAEYIIALSSNFTEEESKSIPGSLYAKKEIEKGDNSFNLEKGTYKDTGETRGTYWQAPFGAFGQYYSGAIKDIGLIGPQEKESRAYVRTSSKEGFVSGQDLAEAFDLSIPLEKKELFFNAIQSGKINESDLRALLPELDLSTVPESSVEEILLTQLLLQEDYPLGMEEEPLRMRRSTTKLVLQFASEYSDEFLSARAITVEAYLHKGIYKGEPNDCLFGWYYYQFNEFWQFACTAILNGMLLYLEKQKQSSIISLNQFIDEIVSEIVTEICMNDDNLTPESSLSDFFKHRYPKLEFNIFGAYHIIREEKDAIYKAAFGLQMIWQLFEENKEYLPKIKEYIFSRNLGHKNEFNSAIYLSQFESLQSQSLRDYIRSFLLKHIIYRHQFVAFKKIGGGSKSTEKFIIEDNKIRYVDNFNPFFTGPRVGNLINFLKTLRLLKEEGGLTEKGQNILSKLD